MITILKMEDRIRRFNYLSEVKLPPILKRPFVQHLFFWVLYFTLNVLRWGLFYENFTYSVESNLVEFPIHLVLVYFNLFYLLPRFFPEKLGVYMFLLLLAISLAALARMLTTYYIISIDLWTDFNNQTLETIDFNHFIAMFVGEIYVVGFTMAIKMAMDYLGSLKKAQALEHKRLETELSFLKSQIQPHFFFNTLNNLYSLTLVKSDKAPETVLKLSELMSYVIYQGKDQSVSLYQEINQINNYLDLEILRYGERLKSSIEITGNLDEQYIPPLVLLPFIENSFKHGNTESNQFPIKIGIFVCEKILTFRVENECKLPAFVDQKHKANEGIGLKNLKRRLDLLFHDQYNLEIDENEKTYKTKLTIPLYDKLPDS